MRIALVCVGLVAALLLGACGSPESRAGEQRGVAEADRDIAAGRPALLFIGLPGPDASPLDPETGLPRWSYGCVVDDESMAYTNSYNTRILDALGDGELEGMTYRRKVTTRDALHTRFEAEGGYELRFGGPPAEAPGGRHAVELAPRSATSDTPYVFVIDRETGARRELHYVGEPKARVLFDHEGTTLLVRDDQYRLYRTFDIPRGIVLQAFPDPDRGW